MFMENLIHDLFKPLITFHICYSYLFVISLFENFLSYYLQVNEFTFGCSSLNLRLMLSAASACYIIILHGLWSSSFWKIVQLIHSIVIWILRKKTRNKCGAKNWMWWCVAWSWLFSCYFMPHFFLFASFSSALKSTTPNSI